mgnify:CR=1 FL=1
MTVTPSLQKFELLRKNTQMVLMLRNHWTSMPGGVVTKMALKCVLIAARVRS